MSAEKGDSIVAKSDEMGSKPEHEASTQDLPQYSESAAPAYEEKNIASHPSGTYSESSSTDHAGPSYPIPVPDVMLYTLVEPRDAIANYFTDIRNSENSRIGRILEAGIVTVETNNRNGETPLLAAIEAGHISTTRLLLAAGADPNAFGAVPKKKGEVRSGRRHGCLWREDRVYRTPLQLAAAKGSLAIVKLLIDDYSADDALVAPDGELALRLAAANGHREVVAYLPVRRGGGFRRWKTRHAVAMRRVKRAVKGLGYVTEFFLYSLPKLFLWMIPKHVVVLPVARRVKWLYRHRAELPRIVINGLKKLWAGVKKLPKGLWEFLKGTARFMVRLVDFIIDVVIATITGLPKATRLAALWMWSGVKTLLRAVAWVFDRLFSFLHTAVMALVTFFKTVTLRNVWDGFVAFVRAVLVDGPKKLGLWLGKFGHTVMRMLKALWGDLGELLGWLFWALVKVAMFVPKRLGEIIVGVLKSAGYGGKEVLIWINPKRV
ncbi:hypothetical protein F5Y10DRAFT_234258 [Nemania abortiva]|nr:hypothetical protein F5Y10DRAFT_234258 [Nemania abortiva]